MTTPSPLQFDDLCDRCMRSGVEVHRTDENGSTVCVECDADEAEGTNALPRHSPGEWRIGTAHDGMPSIDVMMPDESGDRYPIAELVGLNADNNARLFVAAPQLLAALQSILEYASDWETGCDDPRDIKDAEDAHASAIEAARLAIATATT